MPSEIVEYINLVFKVLRWTLISVNAVVIVAALYFMISAKGLGGDWLDISTGVLITLGLLSIAVAILGIVAAVWWGNKTKIHLMLVICYVAASLVLMIVGVILAAIYVRDQNSADVLFTVLIVVISFCVIMSSLGFAYAVKKTKVLRRLNVVTG